MPRIDLTLTSHESTRLYGQLTKWQAHDLLATVNKVAAQSEAIAKLVIKEMPQYTLHDARHHLNVLAIMDALLPDDTLAQLQPLECALTIMSAFVHDLGMACSAQHLRDIRNPETPDGKRFESFCAERFGELLRYLKRPDQQAAKAEAIRGHLVAEFLRQEHTLPPDVAGCPINDWLAAMEKDGVSFVYESTSYRYWLAQIAVSHGQNASWLRQELDPEHTGAFLTGVARGEKCNLAFPALLLRLADLMDFDDSRTPDILYRHLAIEEDVSLDQWQHWLAAGEPGNGPPTGAPANVSWREWNKHRAVTNIDFTTIGNQRTYEITANCRHPVVQKTILQFCDWIDDELNAVRDECAAQWRLIGERFPSLPPHDNQRPSAPPYRLDLPECVWRRGIKPANDERSGQPLYQYEDIEFRLDQEEIMQLLMGEQLYDKPWLCIRELLQNSLDALELRDLRNQLDLERPQAQRRADPVDEAAEGELQVTLRWGREGDQEWLEVEDNGVGMTLDVIKNYFTQIGKSYYRSPGYRREQAELLAAGHRTSPISQFGIGILSCFMLAERLEVRTHPGVCSGEPPHDITISGPGSLFWIKAGTRQRQGTVVRLHLKQRYQIKHRPDTVLQRLREDFDYAPKEAARRRQEEKEENAGRVFDPAHAALRHCVWPRYSVCIEPPAGEGKPIMAREDGARGAWQFNPNAAEVHCRSFHGCVLMAPLLNGLAAKAREWGIPGVGLGWPHWCWSDVTDASTGSRLRLWYVRPDDLLGNVLPREASSQRFLSLAHLAALTESQLLNAARTTNLVQSMFVEHTNDLAQYWQIAEGMGAVVWFDWRGPATPALKTDRSAARPPDHEATWARTVAALFGAVVAEYRNTLKTSVDLAAARNLRVLLAWHRRLRPQLGSPAPSPGRRRVRGSLAAAPSLSPAWGKGWFYSDLARAPVCARDLVRDQDLADALSRDQELMLDRHHGRPSAHDLARDRVLDCEHARDRDRDTGLALGLVSSPALGLARVLVFARAANRATCPPLAPWREALSWSLLPEMFQPNLADSLPILDCFGLEGRLGDLRLVGPAVVDPGPLAPGSDGELRKVEYQVRTESWLDPRLWAYDLIFPLTGISLGALRQRCLAWRTDLCLRPLAALLFHAPEVAEETAHHAGELVGELFHVERILALLPHERLYDKAWDEWTAADWEDPGLSALWDIRGGWVKWGHGLAFADDLAKHGVDLDDLGERAGTH